MVLCLEMLCGGVNARFSSGAGRLGVQVGLAWRVALRHAPIGWALTPRVHRSFMIKYLNVLNCDMEKSPP